MTDVKFGILLWSQAASWDEMLDGAKRVDRLGSRRQKPCRAGVDDHLPLRGRIKPSQQ